jgi:hypothetical protein
MASKFPSARYLDAYSTGTFPISGFPYLQAPETIPFVSFFD